MTSLQTRQGQVLILSLSPSEPFVTLSLTTQCRSKLRDELKLCEHRRSILVSKGQAWFACRSGHHLSISHEDLSALQVSHLQGMPVCQSRAVGHCARPTCPFEVWLCALDAESFHSGHTDGAHLLGKKFYGSLQFVQIYSIANALGALNCKSGSILDAMSRINA